MSNPIDVPWKITPLIDFAASKKSSFVNGPFGSDLLASELQATGVPVIYIRDITDGRYQRKSTVCVTAEKASQLSACKTVTGDVLLSKVGDPPCEAALYTDDLYAIVTQDVIRIHPSQDTDPRFLVSLFNSEIGRRQIKRIAIEGTRLRVSLTDLKKVKLPHPPYPEQKKMGNIFETWDKAIALTERRIKAAQQRKKALMQRLLTGRVRFPEFKREKWQQVSLGNVAQVIMGQSPSSQNYNEEEDGLPLIQGNADITNGRTSPKVYTSEITKRCELGDIIVSVRAPVGNVALSVHEACIGRGVCAIRAQKANASFLYQVLVSIEPQWERYAQGSTFKAVNSKDIKSFRLVIPESREEQRRIAAVLQACDREIDLLTQKLAALQRQKKGLMQRLLTGQVRVKV